MRFEGTNYSLLVILQVLLQDVKTRMQILDLVTYMLVVLANMEQVYFLSCFSSLEFSCNWLYYIFECSHFPNTSAELQWLI